MENLISPSEIPMEARSSSGISDEVDFPEQENKVL
jgi:hypothetical protein